MVLRAFKIGVDSYLEQRGRTVGIDKVYEKVRFGFASARGARKNIVSGTSLSTPWLLLCDSCSSKRDAPARLD